MSILDFVKEAGHALGISGGDAPTADSLKTAVEQLGFDTSGLDVEVDGDKAMVSGQVPSQEEKEKIVLALGNCKGIASVDDKIEVAQDAQAQSQSSQSQSQSQGGVSAAAPASFYTVEDGDTLSSIAKKQYGSANKYEVIFRANQPMLKDPNAIYPGQVLRIPPLQ
ncbi:MAG TPA: peptidoglycan-binding protein LysM [Patescibacteria group bacterium]|nr:peptidoglycan-binding protein LysM [Patescibacteria group bacterium]